MWLTNLRICVMSRCGVVVKMLLLPFLTTKTPTTQNSSRNCQQS